jgi:O-antigen ligase
LLSWPRSGGDSSSELWLSAAAAFVIPASFVAYQSRLQFADWLPNSARARVLWEYTAEQTLKSPLLGVGVDSTPVLSKQQKAGAAVEKPDGFIFPRTTGHHAHDMFLQVWYELGAVGALLLAIAGVAVVMLIVSLPATAQQLLVEHLRPLLWLPLLPGASGNRGSCARRRC